MMANSSTHIGQARAEGGFEPITESGIASVRTPTLVISGANSPSLFQQLAALLSRLLPNSRSFEVPNASHAMHAENPEAVNSAILTFLDEHMNA